ncbi:MAG: rRNA pseudouridine synthase [Clostridiales bacterium]|nr:rRNA pseudouridine synthase [Clostridiales bacterium]
MRLDKRVTALGLTRTQAKKMIAQGAVSVNGCVEKDPGAAVKDTDDVRVQGAKATVRGHVHYMVHKPKGVLTATRDGREKTVVDLIDSPPRDLGPIGRLDKDVTGLVLLTTDGQLAHRLISPRFEVGKLYRAHVEGALDESAVQAFAAGIPLKDFTARPAKLTLEGESCALVEVCEGKYHQVKRMFQAIGHPVVELERLRISDVWLDKNLAPGEYRELTEEETALLYEAAGMKQEN